VPADALHMTGRMWASSLGSSWHTMPVRFPVDPVVRPPLSHPDASCRRCDRPGLVSYSTGTSSIHSRAEPRAALSTGLLFGVPAALVAQNQARRRRSGASLHQCTAKRAHAKATPANSGESVFDYVRQAHWAPMNVFLVVFLHLLGFTMGGPIVPVLRQHFGLDALQTGRITSAFPGGMFFAVFLWPALSDVIGRKPVLVLAYFGVGVGFVLQSLALYCGGSFEVFLGLRFMSGLFAGASTVTKAYIADMASPGMLSRLFAFKEAAATLAFIIGPTLGGLLAQRTSLPVVVLCMGLTSIVSSFIVFVFLRCPSTCPQDKLEESAPGSDSERPASKESESCPLGNPWPALLTIMVVSFAYNFGQSFFDAYFPLFATEKLGRTPAQLGYMLTAMACSVFVSSVLYAKAAHRFGTVRIAVIGLLSIAAALFGISTISTWWTVFVPLALYAFVGVPWFTPSVPTILTTCAPDGRRGQTLGFSSACNAVARILAPLAMGATYQLGPPAAFQTAVVVLAGALVMVLRSSLIRSWV